MWVSTVTRRQVSAMLACVLSVLAAGSWAIASPTAASAPASAATVYRFAFDGLDGGRVPLSAYAGKVIMIVNTASKCGFTHQYAGLQRLYETYGAQGFVVIGVPSNDFGGQEPGSAKDIAALCGGTYGVTFPMAAKAEVKGASAHPFYIWAGGALGLENAPRWNFHKYLVDRDGRLVAAFSSSTPPESRRIVSAVEELLGAATIN